MNTPARKRREAGFTFLEHALLVGLISLGGVTAIEKLKASGAIGGAPAGASSTAASDPAASALAQSQVMAMEAEQAPLDITAEEMRELINTAKGLEAGGSFACPGPAGLKQDPIFAQAFGLGAGVHGGP